MLSEGAVAPDFSAKDQNGETVKLADFRGRKVVLYFYPKDDTPGCTKEACSLRDGFAEFQAKNIEILGVSGDDESKHRKFVAKYELPFTLLADTDHSVAELYESYSEKTFMGKTYNGVLRRTFLIDADGVIKKIFDKVNVNEHADEVLEAFDA